MSATKKTSSRNLKSKARRLKRRVYSVTQLLTKIRKQKKRKGEQKQLKKPIKPIIPPKSLIVLLKDKPEKAIYNRRIIDYKHCGLLQRYIGLGGKILPRRQTRLTALDLISCLAAESNPKQWLHMPESEMSSIISQIIDQNLKLTLAFGIGLHHAVKFF